ncbi:MAG: L,D-transpeptidase [Actinobacteria bacterium]|nr:L,D-transpeptidase [Actinomycetota bacterium]
MTKTLEHPTATGGALVFLIEAEWQGWYRVQVPTPPAGTSGWIQASAVDVAEHHIHVTIDLGDHLLEVTDAGEPVLHAPIAVGAHDTPRPGITFVTESIEMANPRTGYGTHALTLAGYPNGDETFFRGQGLVAIHGLDDPLALGQTVEDGSIGLSNADVKKLFQLVPPGTPVEILGEG